MSPSGVQIFRNEAVFGRLAFRVPGSHDGAFESSLLGMEFLQLHKNPQSHNASPSLATFKLELDAAIMASPELSARLQYLNDSAHLLAAAAPETSRHLMSRHNSLLFDSNLDPSEAQKRKACGACGTIMILGWNGVLELKQPGRKNRRRHGGVSKTQRAVVYTCECCRRKTRHPFPAPRQKYNPGTKSSKPAPVSATASASSRTPQAKDVPTVSQSSNSSSKKRAKNRKQGSLQAILAKQKASEGASGSGFGLDLMDFMKNG
jgi:ribonuclease MRP protein subunit SNM1